VVFVKVAQWKAWEWEERIVPRAAEFTKESQPSSWWTFRCGKSGKLGPV